jgi:hypothetical protein
MTDKQWLRAMQHYNNEERRRRRNPFRGGASQLASELQHFTKSDPTRFGHLLTAIPDDANEAYIEHALWGLAEADDVPREVLKAAIENAHQRPSRPYGRAIVRIFERHTQIAVDRDLFDILTWYVENGDAVENNALNRPAVEREVVTIDDLLEKGGRLHVRRINGTRGMAAEALGTVMWQVPDAISWCWNLVERRVSQEPIISVRCGLMHALLPLFESNRGRCALLVEKLVDAPEPLEEAAHGTRQLAPLITHEGTRFLPYILQQVPAVGRRLVQRLMQSPSEILRMFGAWHVMGQSFSDEAYRDEADRFIEQGPAYRRLAADLAAHAFARDEFRERAERLLIRFFADEDIDVRRQTADAFRNIEPQDFYRYKGLAEQYISSRAFDTEAFALLHALGTATCDVTDLVVLAAVRLVSDLERDGGAAGRRTSELHQLQDLLQREYVASEGNPEVRKKMLDLIDSMLACELYGTDAIVKEHDRS